MSAQEDLFLSRDEVARRLNKSTTTIDRLVASGKLRSIRPPGTHWRLIPQKAVDEFLYGEQSLASVHELSERRKRV